MYGGFVINSNFAIKFISIEAKRENYANTRVCFRNEILKEKRGKEGREGKARDVKSFATVLAHEGGGGDKRVASRQLTLRIRLRKILPRHQMHHRGFSEGKPKSTERDIAVQETTLVD